MEISVVSLIVILTMLALAYAVWQNVSKQLTMQSYVATTYMYVFFALLMIVLINDVGFVQIESGAKSMALFMLTIILTVAVAVIPPKNQIMKHLAWLALIGCLAIFMAPVINVAKQQNILNNVLITVSVMFITMTYFAYSQPLGFFNSWYPFLFTGLIGIVVLSLLNVIFSDLDSYGFTSRNFIISCVTILLFNGFLLYDTQKILKEGVVLDTICTNQDNLVCSDYPAKSMSIFMDIINMFASTTAVYSKR